MRTPFMKIVWVFSVGAYGVIKRCNSLLDGASTPDLDLAALD
jgi:hypothetical protein